MKGDYELEALIRGVAQKLGPEWSIILVTKRRIAWFLFLAFLVIFLTFVLGHVVGMTLAKAVCDGGLLGSFAYGNCP